MERNFIYQNVDDALPGLLYWLLEGGEENGSRNGLVKEFMHTGITLTHPWQREILIPNRKANLAAQIAESMWVLSGRNDIEWLGHYLPRAKDYSDDGETWRGGYGPRLRRWEGNAQVTRHVDQLKHVVELLRADPLTRRAVMSIYDPYVDTLDGKDIPCNNWLTFSSRLGKLDLHVGIRSNDIMWGWSGINAFEWSVLQEVVAGMLGIGVGHLHFSTTSLHLYAPHWAKAGEIAKFHTIGVGGGWEDSARFKVARDTSIEQLDGLVAMWFDLEADIRNGNPCSGRVDNFPEPMFRSWLRVLQWWWTGDRAYLLPLGDTRLHQAGRTAMRPPERTVACESVPCPPEEEVVIHGTPFMHHVTRLHTQKHAAYGDSWKRRGEMLGILANIARKVDRLGGAETDDETSADTAIDLLVYLAKYITWLADQVDDSNQSDDPAFANKILWDVDRMDHNGIQPGQEVQEQHLRDEFEVLENLATRYPSAYEGRITHVSRMVERSYELARMLWETTSDPATMVDPAYRGADAD